VWFWWPGGLEFRSDDYLAVAWASKPAHVAHDFVGPQYGVPRLALFYRPLITASIAFDTWLGGAKPFVPLLANLIVHIVNCGLLFLLLRTVVSPTAAFAGMAAWSLHSGHTEAISWMVGRVDVYPTLFYLGCLVCDARARNGHRWFAPAAWVCCGLALMTKELALTLPGALLLVRGPKSWTELRHALSEIAPYLWILSGFLAVRYLTLGEAIGGYEATQISWLAPLDPLWPRQLRPGEFSLLLATPYVVALACMVPALRRNRRLIVTLAALAVVTALPSAGSAGTSKPERYNYLPNAAIMGLLAAGGPVPPVLAMLSELGVGCTRRTELREVCGQVHAIRDRTEQALSASRAGDQPVFVAAPDSIHGFVAFAVGFDRLGRPPFWSVARPLLPARAIFSGEPEQRPRAELGRAAPFYAGPEPLDAAALYRVNAGLPAGIGLEGIAGARYLVTIATAQGWLRCAVQAKPMPGRNETVAGVRDVLGAALLGKKKSLAGRGVVLELWPSVEVAADPSPWVHVAAVDASGTTIAAANRWIQLPLTRDLWRALDKPKRGNLVLVLLVAVLAFACGRYAAPPSSRSDKTASSSSSSSSESAETENDASARSHESSSSETGHSS